MRERTGKFAARSEPVVSDGKGRSIDPGCGTGTGGITCHVFSMNSGLRRSMDTVSEQPFLLIVKNFSFRLITRKGPS